MQTGTFESWTIDPNLIGPLYPFVGTEFLLFIIGMVVWLIWTVWQIRHENAMYREEAASMRQGKNLENALGKQ